MNKKSVVLKPACVWECPTCQNVQYEHLVKYKPESEEEEQQLRFRLGLKPWENADILSTPETVICYVCEESFETDEDGSSV